MQSGASTWNEPTHTNSQHVSDHDMSFISMLSSCSSLTLCELLSVCSRRAQSKLWQPGFSLLNAVGLHHVGQARNLRALTRKWKSTWRSNMPAPSVSPSAAPDTSVVWKLVVTWRLDCSHLDLCMSAQSIGETVEPCSLGSARHKKGVKHNAAL